MLQKDSASCLCPCCILYFGSAWLPDNSPERYPSPQFPPFLSFSNYTVTFVFKIPFYCVTPSANQKPVSRPKALHSVHLYSLPCWPPQALCGSCAPQTWIFAHLTPQPLWAITSVPATFSVALLGTLATSQGWRHQLLPGGRALAWHTPITAK